MLSLDVLCSKSWFFLTLAFAILFVPQKVTQNELPGSELAVKSQI